MKLNHILEMKIMHVPYREEFAENKVLFVTHHLGNPNEVMVDSELCCLGRASRYGLTKKDGVDDRSIGERI